MSDKERLEKIKENWNNVVWGIDKSDINWLIKQAERVQELEEENTGLKQDLKDVSDRLEWVSDV